MKWEMTERDRPWSWWRLEWTDTGERPWWWCVLIAAVCMVSGLESFYDGKVYSCCLFLLVAGDNIGRWDRQSRCK